MYFNALADKVNLLCSIRLNISFFLYVWMGENQSQGAVWHR